MNKQEVIKENIRCAGYTPGRSVKGKGLEVFSLPMRVVGGYIDSEKTGLKDKKRLLAEMEKHKRKNLFVREIGIGEKNYNFEGNYTESLQKFPLKKLQKNKLKGVKYIYIDSIPEIKAYVNVSKYNTDMGSQQEMIVDLISKAEGKKVIGDFQESSYDKGDWVIAFDNSFEQNGVCHQYNGDYTLYHGTTLCLAPSELKSISISYLISRTCWNMLALYQYIA